MELIHLHIFMPKETLYSDPLMNNMMSTFSLVKPCEIGKVLRLLYHALEAYLRLYKAF